MSVCVFLRISRKNLDNEGKITTLEHAMTEAQLVKRKQQPWRKSVVRVNFKAKTHKKRKELCRKKIIEDLADVQTVNNEIMILI